MGLSRRTVYVLQGVAIALLILLFRRAFVDVDLINYDSLWYHLPYAARLWRITTPEQFAYLPRLEQTYRGFPLLGEALQGFLWIFFDHMQAANLVALGSLLAYCWFSWVILAIPWFLTFLALLAVPLIQIHATGALVDLPTNLATAVVLLVVYRVYARTGPPSWKELAFLVVAAGVSINMKFLHLAVVCLALLAVGGRLASLYRASEPGARRRIARMLLVLLVTAPVVFATPARNTIVYGNPVYPLAVGVAGFTLPHTWAWPPTLQVPDYLRRAPQPVRWLLSVFEYRAFDPRRPFLWTGEQGSLPKGVPAYRMGGYFFLYVIANLVLLGCLVWRLGSRDARVAGALVLLLSLITSVHPESHDLRYYMFWMIVLVTLNLYLLANLPPQQPFRVTLERFGILCCVMVLVVAGLTRGAYLRPWTQAIVVDYLTAIEPTIRAAVERSPMLCVVGNPKMQFLYASTFHPPLQYSVKAAKRESQCGSRLVVPVQ